jgi:hypothetical protein
MNVIAAQSGDLPRLPAGAIPIPQPQVLEQVSSREAIDQAIAELHANKDGWACVDLATKAVILDEVHHDLLQLGEQWVEVSLRAKHVPPGGFAEGEEWVIYSGVLRLVRLLQQSLHDIHHSGRPHLPGTPMMLGNGQVATPMFPTSRLEQLLFPGVRATTWLEPGVHADDLFLVPGASERYSEVGGRVALVLGAGNMSGIQCADLLHKLFVEQQVVVLKMNPVNTYLGSLLEHGFRALVSRGVLRIVHGGADVGAYLCDHPQVNTLHLTGSDKTFDTIVFGPGAAGAERKADNRPRLAKPLTAELGGVNPVIVLPGDWSSADIERAALMLATWLYSNAGFACLAPRLLIQHRQWPQRQALLDALGRILSETPLRAAYYPGAHERHAAFRDAHPQAQEYGDVVRSSAAPSDSLRWTVIPGVAAEDVNDSCFRTEAFCALLAETALDAPDTAGFLERATTFANTTVWGTLAATLLVPDQVRSAPPTSSALQRAVGDLRYGTICINLYTGFAYSLMTTPWGSFPGQQTTDIQSGTGFVNNPSMLRRPQKTIFDAPFKRIDPVTIRHRSVATFCKQYADFQAWPSLTKLLKLFWTATRV